MAPLGIAYAEFLQTLRVELPKKTQTRTRYGHAVPVYPFAYDWRQPLALTVQRLKDFVEEVIERTKLTEHYAADEDFMADPRVSLVGHSMGGLVAYGYMASTEGARVGKFVSIATPFQGSPYAVERMTISRDQPAMREVARITPGVYHLLPSYDRALRRGPDTDVPARTSIFNINCWQPSILTAVERYVRTHGLGSADDRRAQAQRVQRALLKQAADFRRLTDGFDPSSARDARGQRYSPDDFLFIAGIGQETIQHITVRGRGRHRWFELGREEDGDGSLHTGDDTVPYLSAAPKFVDLRSPGTDWSQRVLCVRPSAMSWWREGGDRVMASAAGLHAMIMNVDAVQRICVGHLEAEPGTKGWVHSKILDLVERPISWPRGLGWKPFRND
jgi:pimeloyl-ACP methyl ester carboxylesterase